MRTGLLRRTFLEYPVLPLGLLYLAVVVPLRPSILDARNLYQLLLSMTPLLILAIGELFVLLSAGIDLSLSAVISLASVCGAWLMVGRCSPLAGSPAAVPGAIVVMLLVGLLIGALHGAAVSLLGMPAFLVTLTSLMFLGGLATWLTRSQQIAGLPDVVPQIWHGRLLVPNPVLVAGTVAVVAHMLLSRTVIGRRLYAVGHSSRTARVSGIRVNRVVVFAYMVCGFCSALAAVLLMARLETGSPTLVPMDILLDCIGAVVLGGTSLFGGKGTVLGTVFGVFFITLVGNTLNMLGLGLEDVLLVKGGAIFLAALVDSIRTRFLAMV